MDVIPSVSSASWQFLCDRWLSASAVVSCIRIVFLCNRWLRWGSVVLILRIRIVRYWRYLPCSLYQTCLVHDTTLHDASWNRLDIGSGIVANAIRRDDSGGTDRDSCMGWLDCSDNLLTCRPCFFWYALEFWLCRFALPLGIGWECLPVGKYW